jgi:23S rRNA (cytosine1962-C5)-methyltransferase
MPSVKNCKTRSSVGDAFEVMDQLRGETHGVVVVDPPSFAHKQADVDRAMRAYIKLTSLAVPLVRPGGVLVQSSCSSRVSVEEFEDSVLGAIRRSGRLVKAIERTGHPIDHPIGFDEGAYLKTLFVTLG